MPVIHRLYPSDTLCGLRTEDGNYFKQTPRIGKNLSTEGQFNTRIARTRVRARLEVLRLGLTILERR